MSGGMHQPLRPRKLKAPKYSLRDVGRPGFQVLKKPRRCAAGHLCIVWPCIECADAVASSAERTKLGGER